MAEIMYFGHDPRIPEILTNYFSEQKKEKNQTHNLVIAKDEKNMNEYMMAMMFDAIIFEQKFLPGLVHEYTATFRRSRPSFKGKMILAGDESDQLKVFKILDSGWMDYFNMPPDRLLVISKLFMYLAGDKAADNKQVFSLKISQVADLAKPATIEELSEFQCKIKSAAPVPVGDLSIIYTNAIGENGEKLGHTTARCIKSEKHPQDETAHLNTFVFVGVGLDVLQNIRNTLRKAYVASKK